MRHLIKTSNSRARVLIECELRNGQAIAISTQTLRMSLAHTAANKLTKKSTTTVVHANTNLLPFWTYRQHFSINYHLLWSAYKLKFTFCKYAHLASSLLVQYHIDRINTFVGSLNAKHFLKISTKNKSERKNYFDQLRTYT